MQKVKPLLSTILLTLFVNMNAFAQSGATPGFQYQGPEHFQLSAADVFRVRKSYPDIPLTKQLKSIFSKTYYNEIEFRQAIVEQLGEKSTREVFPELKERAKLARQQLTVLPLNDNMVKISYRAVDDDNPHTDSSLLNLQNLTIPTKLQDSEFGFSTDKMVVHVDPVTLCVNISDKKQPINQVCPTSGIAFTLKASGNYQLSGLGQEFQEPGVINGNWNGKIRRSGNQMEGFDGGATGNSMFPILYASSPSQSDFSLYYDNMYSTQWDFTQAPWKVRSAQGGVNLLISIAETQAELREGYMAMVGTPLVPPRKMFGMWLSEYGFDNWHELDDKLITLKQNDFPIDGVVMDLQWFGNIKANDPHSQMGTLTWDRVQFPQPEKKISELKEQGIGMMLIEESYVSAGLNEYRIMEESGFLAVDSHTGKAINTNADGGGSWWGKGGLIDWTNSDAAEKWHDWKREPLIDMGIMGFWTDLGEPEIYNSNGVYADGKSHADIHNWFNFKWLEGIYQGYLRHATEQRPFMMSRSGAPGIQRFGASMWSADISSNLSSLAVHIGMQNNMMLSGIDYYGSDIGGFHRQSFGGTKKDQTDALNEAYTQWFAYSSMFDVPVRPHTENLCNCKQTAPDRIGDMASNKANIELRYQLIPYVYSNAHDAHKRATPLFPSLSYQYPHDAKAQNRMDHKMIGASLLSVGVAKQGQQEVDVYLPAGKWFDYRTGQVYQSKSGVELEQPLYIEKNGDRLYQLPLFAKEGAIIPFNPAPRLTSEVPETLALKVFGSPKHSNFTLYEDDGETNSYLNGEFRTIELQATVAPKRAELKVTTSGNYKGAPMQRPLLLEWYISEQPVKKIILNGKPIDSWEQHKNYVTLKLDKLDTHIDTIELEFI